MFKKILSSKWMVFSLGLVLGSATTVYAFKTGVSAAKEQKGILLNCIGADGLKIVKEQAEEKGSIKPIFEATEECKKLLKSV